MWSGPATAPYPGATDRSSTAPCGPDVFLELDAAIGTRRERAAKQTACDGTVHAHALVGRDDLAAQARENAR
jgi:hypothetical protein